MTLIDLLLKHDDVLQQIDTNVTECISYADRADKCAFVLRQLDVWRQRFELISHREEAPEGASTGETQPDLPLS
jgi:hypothetical protein